MHPHVWGRDTWRSIHFIALGYPSRASQEVQDTYATYFGVLGSVLPCVKCSKHYNEHLQSYPVGPSLVGRAELFRWTVDLHNAVNTSLGRSSWSYEQAFEVYADSQVPASGRGVRITTFSVSLLITVALIGWWLRRRRRMK